MSLTIARLDDAELLLDMNNAAVPDIGELNLVKAQWLVGHAVTPGLALLDDQPAGIIVVLNDHCGYDSDYYRWFTDRYQNFLYIDRVVVAPWARGQGVAKAIYADLERVAEERKLAIVADVYSEPPNVPSLNLHRAMGFHEVGTQYFPAIQKTAAKFMKHAERAQRKT